MVGRVAGMEEMSNAYTVLVNKYEYNLSPAPTRHDVKAFVGREGKYQCSFTL
jgi:hypothetical protein